MPEAANQHPSEETPAAPLSPELVLVDPELARLARERLVVGDSPAAETNTTPSAWESRDHVAAEADDEALPPYARRERLVGPSSALDLDTVRARASEAAAAETAARRVRKRKRRRWTLASVTTALAAAAAVGIFVVEAASNGPTGGPSGVTRTSGGDEALGLTGEARRPPLPSQPSPPARLAPPPRTSPPTSSTKPARPAPQSAFPTRVFVWPAVSRAAFYKVEFFRRGKKIFEASPAKARLELPLRWSYRGRRLRLTRGTYRWEVRPAFGPRSRPRYGQPVTQSTWVAR